MRARDLPDQSPPKDVYRSIVELCPQAILVAQAGRIRFANPGALQLCGFTAPELLGRRCLSLVPAEDRKATIRRYRELELASPSSGTPQFRALSLRVPALGRSPRWVEVRPVTAAWQGAPCTLLFLSDITDKKLLELQFLHAQKMEAVGRLAGGIAHDMNNMLTVILGQCQLMQAGDEPQVHPRLAEIRQAAEKAISIVRQLLLLSRRPQHELRVIDLNELIEGLEVMLRRLVGEGIRIEKRLDPGLGAIHADPALLEQALLNLAANARDAMDRQGTLTLSTANTEIAEPVLPPLSDLPPGRYVNLAVADTGAGMDQATLEHVFEPFFTTKPSGRGTGLGLSTVYGIVKKCSGAIHVHSRPGLGSSFRLYFPRVDRDPTGSPPAAVRPTCLWPA